MTAIHRRGASGMMAGREALGAMNRRGEVAGAVAGTAADLSRLPDEHPRSFCTVEPRAAHVRSRRRSPMAMHSYLVTNGVPIRRSVGEHQVIFIEWSDTVELDGMKRVMISSDVSGSGGVIVDNDIIVNGRRIPKGFDSTFADPMKRLGQPVEAAYAPIPAVDITGDMRHDRRVYVQLVDFGYTYGSSRLYVVVLTD
ncbi:hypothetical protein [Nannocystis punicea]|uniref:Uncharacterized protein n=1 Tax=Nannocystis punicea TaxID=2995304 RepID=A0ABY7HDS5_9BACT|nr:hypothetical protein [Nannocystis poenicansa]WAS97423.1 hypothetical protein O0S08_14845 [Nannocystis poenicansa]